MALAAVIEMTTSSIASEQRGAAENNPPAAQAGGARGVNGCYIHFLLEAVQRLCVLTASSKGFRTKVSVATCSCSPKNRKEHASYTRTATQTLPPPQKKDAQYVTAASRSRTPPVFSVAPPPSARQPPPSRAQKEPPQCPPHTTAHGGHPRQSARATQRTLRAAVEKPHLPGAPAARAAAAAPAPRRRGAELPGQPGSETTRRQSIAWAHIAKRRAPRCTAAGGGRAPPPPARRPPPTGTPRPPPPPFHPSPEEVARTRPPRARAPPHKRSHSDALSLPPLGGGVEVAVQGERRAPPRCHMHRNVVARLTRAAVVAAAAAAAAPHGGGGRLPPVSDPSPLSKAG